MYDCQTCLAELGQLPHVHQNSAWVLSMVGRVHYEKQDYASVRPPFIDMFELALIHLLLG